MGELSTSERGKTCDSFFFKDLVVLFLVYPVGDVWASYTFQAELITRVCSSEFIIVFKKNRIPWIPRVKLSNFYIPGIALD